MLESGGGSVLRECSSRKETESRTERVGRGMRGAALVCRDGGKTLSLVLR